MGRELLVSATIEPFNDQLLGLPEKTAELVLLLHAYRSQFPPYRGEFCTLKESMDVVSTVPREAQ